MDKADCFNLGHISKLHGFKGEVSLFLDVTYPDEYSKMEFVFVELNGNLSPFFIEQIRPTNKGFIRVKFNGVNSEEQAKLLIGTKVFLPLNLLPELKGNDFYDHEVIGFNVVDLNLGPIGKLIQIIDLPSNPLFEIENDGVEILIPLRKEFIEKINRKERTILLKTPEGLIAVYRDQ